MRAGTDFVHFQQFQPAAVQHFNRVFAAERSIQLNVAAVERIEILIHTGKGDGVTVGLNLQNQLDEIAQL
ncbi:hypothetical protein D3C72_1835420 [compost metagenome]